MFDSECACHHTSCVAFPQDLSDKVHRLETELLALEHDRLEQQKADAARSTAVKEVVAVPSRLASGTKVIRVGSPPDGPAIVNVAPPRSATSPPSHVSGSATGRPSTSHGVVGSTPPRPPVVAHADISPQSADEPYQSEDEVQTAPASAAPTSVVVLQERQLGDGKLERKYSDGRRVVSFKNGTEKELTSDGQTIVRFANGDVKQTNPQTGAVVYFYAEAKTTHTTLADGTEIFDFPSGQVWRCCCCSA